MILQASGCFNFKLRLDRHTPPSHMSHPWRPFRSQHNQQLTSTADLPCRAWQRLFYFPSRFPASAVPLSAGVELPTIGAKWLMASPWHDPLCSGCLLDVSQLPLVTHFLLVPDCPQPYGILVPYYITYDGARHRSPDGVDTNRPLPRKGSIQRAVRRPPLKPSFAGYSSASGSSSTVGDFTSNDPVHPHALCDQDLVGDKPCPRLLDQRNPPVLRLGCKGWSRHLGQSVAEHADALGRWMGWGISGEGHTVQVPQVHSLQEMVGGGYI